MQGIEERLIKSEQARKDKQSAEKDIKKLQAKSLLETKR